MTGLPFPLRRALAVLALLAGLGPMLAAESRAEPVMVFAAASTTNALDEIVVAFNATGRGPVRTSFASSSTLARQIEQGAPADLFLSANVRWMDHLAETGLIDGDSRVDLLANRLTLIAPLETALNPMGTVTADTPLAGMLGADGRLALGDPDHVPAGLYAKQALEGLGLWTAVAGRLAPINTVRAALALVQRSETPLGIVYATDAAQTTQITALGLFPADSHPPIRYPAALVAGRDNADAAAFLTFLRGPEAGAIFTRYGFEILN